MILVNRSGGAASAAGTKLRERIAAALAAHGIAGEIELIDGGDIAARAAEAAEAGAPLLIVGGGDGSISAAAGALAGRHRARAAPAGHAQPFRARPRHPGRARRRRRGDRRRPPPPHRCRRGQPPHLRQQ